MEDGLAALLPHSAPHGFHMQRHHKLSVHFRRQSCFETASKPPRTDTNMLSQEHWTAVMGAYKDKLDLSISVAVGSSIQIA